MIGAQRGRVVAWAALLTGIGASIAANIAHARTDLGPRLLSALLPFSVDGLAAVGALAVVEIGRASRADAFPKLGEAFAGRVSPIGDRISATSAAAVQPSTNVDDVVDEQADGADGPADELTLLANAVAADLRGRGRTVSRDALARGIRERGRSVSSARASALLRQLKAA